MNESISRLAAVPTAAQPCGANGVQWSARLSGSAVTIATSSSAASTAARPSCIRAPAFRPTALTAVTAAIITAAPPTAPAAAGVEQLGDVETADEADGRGAQDHPGQEPPAGDRAHPRPE